MVPQLLQFFTLCAFHLCAKSETVSMPTFAFSWLDGRDTFAAGDVATLKVRVLGNFERKKFEHAFNPNITVNDKLGNSSYVSGVFSHFGDDFNDWRISFIPIMAGLFNVLITDDHFKVFDSSLHFRVTPGPIYPSTGVVSWLDEMNEFAAGVRAIVLVLPKDAFGNNVSSSPGQVTNDYNLTILAFHSNGSNANVVNISIIGWDEFGYVRIEFVAATAGNLLLHVKDRNQSLNGSPLPFNVSRGQLDVSSCVPEWKTATNSFQLFSVMETYIRQQDKYGNLVSGLYPFDIELFQKGTNLSMPVADLKFEEVELGIQLFSFSLTDPGDFVLMIFDEDQNTLISTMPYDFTVYIGYCDRVNSIVNGSGLNDSVAGELARFSVFLKDAYLYPSPVELERFQVLIARDFDSDPVQATISPMEMVNGISSISIPETGTWGPMILENASAPEFYLQNTSSRKSRAKPSAFEVIYVPEKSGPYSIHVFCGNIELNSGHPFKKEVRAGEVNTSVSGVVKYAPKVAKKIENEIIVKLMDSYSNPVLSQQSKLKLEIASLNKSGFSTLTFIDKNDGSYIGFYVVEDVGTYEICASFDGNRFYPWPFGVNVYDAEYFPNACDDVISVWEGESIAFDVLENDYFARGNASVVEFSKPKYASLLQFGHIFRYTPYKGFYGNDSFTYTVSDVNGNLASGSVNISVLSIPPQFVSFPVQLYATEDLISPRFGGFPGFEIIYSDAMENVSVTVSANSGDVFLSPMLMQFWQSAWSELSVNKCKTLTLEGRFEAINFALQSIQYLGDENFYGDDIIRISTMNKNGKNHLDVPIYVEPINDPPVIDVPESIFVEGKITEKGFLIIDKKRDNFNFSIADPDLIFPDNESRSSVMFSVELNSGYLSTNLPAELVNTTELKLKNSFEWQPLRTFVTISKHFMVKAKGLRFRGTINDCNDVMQHLSYHGGKHGDVLTVTVNDMGTYGCYPDCKEMMTMPLSTEATVTLLRRRPMSSLLAHSLGSAIVIEFMVVFSLGLALLFFICKCAYLLAREKKNCDSKANGVELSRIQSSSKQTSTTGLSESVTPITRCHSSPLLTHQPLDFCQRLRCQSERGESSMDSRSNTPFSY